MELGMVTATILSGVAATAIAAGGYHTCVVVIGGGVLCWGLNARGQIGTSPSRAGSTSDQYSAEDVFLGTGKHQAFVGGLPVAA